MRKPLGSIVSQLWLFTSLIPEGYTQTIWLTKYFFYFPAFDSIRN